MSHLLMKTLILILLTISPIIGYSCTCSMSLTEAIEESKLILSGKIIGRKVVKHYNEGDIEKTNPWKAFQYKIRVNAIHKGDFYKLVIIESNKPAAACGTRLKLFRNYLLYVEEHKQILYTTKCHPNRLQNKRNKESIEHAIREINNKKNET